MNDHALKQAIELAWEHTQKTAPGVELRNAEKHLAALRKAQLERATSKQDGEGQ